MTSKHTPGPWEFFDTLCIGVMSAQSDVAHCSGYDGNRSRDEELANARLIAAAPDLLAALEALLSYDDMVECADMARAAIAKARGE
jgi:hypothetical protein